MSHNIYYEVHDEKCDKRKVQAEWDATVRHEDYQEGSSGLHPPIRWIDKVLDSYDEALKFIEREDSGWYDSLAVKFRDYSALKPSKEVAALENRIKEANAKYRALDEKVHFADAKSAYISCRTCGSRIARQYITRNYCPVCGHDMRPESTLKRLESLENTIQKLKQQLADAKKEFQQKKMKKATIKWLVKVEYHT